MVESEALWCSNCNRLLQREPPARLRELEYEPLLGDPPWGGQQLVFPAAFIGNHPFCPSCRLELGLSELRGISIPRSLQEILFHAYRTDKSAWERNEDIWREKT